MSAKWRRSHPRDKSGRFLSPKALRRSRRSRRSQSQKRKSRKSRSKSSSGRRGPLTKAERQSLARRLGIRVQDLDKYTVARGRRRLSENIARKVARERKSRKSQKARGRKPTLNQVLKHFMDVIPEKVWCPRKMCGNVYEKHRKLGVLPKSVSDLELILSIPSEQKGLNARCWICLYRSYRELYRKMNGEYPVDAPDVSDDLADRFSVGGVTAILKKPVEAAKAVVAEARQLLALPSSSPETSSEASSEASLESPELSRVRDYIDGLKYYCAATVDQALRGAPNRQVLENGVKLVKSILDDYPALGRGLEPGASPEQIRKNCDILLGNLKKLQEKMEGRE